MYRVPVCRRDARHVRACPHLRRQDPPNPLLLQGPPRPPAGYGGYYGGYPPHPGGYPPGDRGPAPGPPRPGYPPQVSVATWAYDCAACCLVCLSYLL